MNKVLSLAVLILFLSTLSSCAIAGGIFKAGVWVGVLAVIGIIGLIIYLVTRGGNKN